MRESFAKLKRTVVLVGFEIPYVRLGDSLMGGIGTPVVQSVSD